VTLLAPLFFAGLLAVGLPLWLHRLSSDNPNRQRFSSLMFLEAGEPRRVLAKKLQYLLLLALRIAVVVLLALAFVQPAFWRQTPPASGEGAALHILVMDTSASMAATGRWDRARDAAEDILDSLSPGDHAELIAAGRVTEIVSADTADLPVVREGLATLDPGVFHVDYGQLMRALDGVVRGAQMPVVLHLITDAQEAALPTRFAELAPREAAELEIHNVAEGAQPNVALEVLAGSAASGELEASVQSFAEQALRKTVRLELNGATIEQQSLELAPGQLAQVKFGALDLAPGANRVEVSLSPGDDLPQDDTRIVALKRPVPRPVLLVSGDLRARDTLFVDSAMGTLNAVSLETETVTPASLDEKNLAGYAFVVVADAAALAADDAARLRDYVQSGGALLLALGPRSNALTEVPITGERFDSTAAIGAADGYAAVGALDASHPALRGVEGLRAAKFFRYATITPAAEDRVLISLDSGAPLLLERELGSGRVLVFTSSLDREWNDLPVQPAFVPLIAAVSDHLLGGAGFSNDAALGSTLALRAMGMQGGQIFDPEGEPALGLGGGSDDVLLDQIGFYEVAGGGNDELVAVNFDTRESDLGTLDAATIERWQALGRPAGAAAGAGASGTTEAETLVPLGPWILLVLILAAAMESWVGNWHLRIRRGLAA